MGNDFPIYNLLYQEIKACAEHVLEICRNHYFNETTDGKHIISRLHELHRFSEKIKMENQYHPLLDLKYYLENTMLPYPDVNDCMQTMRLSEALSLLERQSADISYFNPEVTRSLHDRCIHHCRKEIKSGRRLHQTLQEIKES